MVCGVLERHARGLSGAIVSSPSALHLTLLRSHHSTEKYTNYSYGNFSRKHIRTAVHVQVDSTGRTSLESNPTLSRPGETTAGVLAPTEATLREHLWACDPCRSVDEL